MTNNLTKVFLIGSGPLSIGQAGEGDCSLMSAAAALKSLGLTVIVADSNASSVSTDPGFCDISYIEPLNRDRLAQIIEKEKPDAVMASPGGLSAIILCAELAHSGVLREHNVRVLGTSVVNAECCEDNQEFLNILYKLNLPSPKGEAVHTVGQALAVAGRIGYPVVCRPSYTRAGAASGIASNEAALRKIAAAGLHQSMIGRVMVEESLTAFKEVEIVLLRDEAKDFAVAGGIECIDPMGVHPSDSITVTPMLTIPEKSQSDMIAVAQRFADHLGLTGCINARFAYDPESGAFYLSKVDPFIVEGDLILSRVSGIDIPAVSALLSCGVALSDIPDRPCVSGVAVKIPRWSFDSLQGAKDILGTARKSSGSSLGVGANFCEAFQKAVRGLEQKREGLEHSFAYGDLSADELLEAIKTPSSERPFMAYEALRAGVTPGQIEESSGIRSFYAEEFKKILDVETALSSACPVQAGDIQAPDKTLLARAKALGFSDISLGHILGTDEAAIGRALSEAHITPAVCRSGHMNYLSWDLPAVPASNLEAVPIGGIFNAAANSKTNAILISGGGAYSIGRGSEFDYALVHAATGLKSAGHRVIVTANEPCSPASDPALFDVWMEPAGVESMKFICAAENVRMILSGFAGKKQSRICEALKESGYDVRGSAGFRPTSPILAELVEAGIPVPESSVSDNVAGALKAAYEIGFPVLLRTSGLRGVRKRSICYDAETLSSALEEAKARGEKEYIIRRFPANARICEVDVVCDGKNVFIPAVIEHIELSGVHAGDSACIIPAVHLTREQESAVRKYAEKAAKCVHAKGLMNVQFAIDGDFLCCLKIKVGSSRSVPLTSKITGIDISALAAKIMILPECASSPLEGLALNSSNRIAVKEAVLPFDAFPEVDPRLGPEMQSIGAVLGVASGLNKSEDLGEAFYKSQEAAGTRLPLSGTVLLSVNDDDKAKILDIAKGFIDLGFNLMATGGTYWWLKANGVDSVKVNKIYEGSPNINEVLNSGEVDLVINTPSDRQGNADDSYIRKDAILMNLPYVTTVPAAAAELNGIRAATEYKTVVRPL